MIKPSSSRKGSAASGSLLHSSLPTNHALYLPSGDWEANLRLASPYPINMSLSHGLSSESTLPLIPLHPLLLTSHHQPFSNMPVSAVEHGQYLTVNSQLSWSMDPPLLPSLHEDLSSHASSQGEARLNSETPSLQSGDGEEETVEKSSTTAKKPKRSRPNRYKNAPPAVIQRRRAANRKSQRAYRKRKDDRIAELEELLDQASQREREMSDAYMTLRANYEQLLMIGGPSNLHQSHSQLGRSLSTASTATATTALSLTTAATSEEEDAASSFMALSAFAHDNDNHHHNHHQNQGPLSLSPQMAHEETSPRFLSIYPPPPM